MHDKIDYFFPFYTHKVYPKSRKMRIHRRKGIEAREAEGEKFRAIEKKEKKKRRLYDDIADNETSVITEYSLFRDNVREHARTHRRGVSRTNVKERRVLSSLRNASVAICPVSHTHVQVKETLAVRGRVYTRVIYYARVPACRRCGRAR